MLNYSVNTGDTAPATYQVCWHWNRAKPVPKIWWVATIWPALPGFRRFRNSTWAESNLQHCIQCLHFNVWDVQNVELLNPLIGRTWSKHIFAGWMLRAKHSSEIQLMMALPFSMPSCFNMAQRPHLPDSMIQCYTSQRRCHAICRSVLYQYHNVWDCMRVFECGCRGALLCRRMSTIHCRAKPATHFRYLLYINKLGRHFGMCWKSSDVFYIICMKSNYYLHSFTIFYSSFPLSTCPKLALKSCLYSWLHGRVSIELGRLMPVNTQPTPKKYGQCWKQIANHSGETTSKCKHTNWKPNGAKTHRNLPQPVLQGARRW